jgi:hypothetical protein
VKYAIILPTIFKVCGIYNYISDIVYYVSNKCGLYPRMSQMPIQIDTQRRVSIETYAPIQEYNYSQVL